MMLLQEGGEQGDRKGRRGGIKGVSNCFKLVKMTMERSMQPVIAFCFSRNNCEAFALEMSKLDFNNSELWSYFPFVVTCSMRYITHLVITITVEEKSLVNEVFTNAIDCLSDEDKKLPQVRELCSMLYRMQKFMLTTPTVMHVFYTCCLVYTYIHMFSEASIIQHLYTTVYCSISLVPPSYV